jgi:hypothetical protein
VTVITSRAAAARVAASLSWPNAAGASANGITSAETPANNMDFLNCRFIVILPSAQNSFSLPRIVPPHTQHDMPAWSQACDKISTTYLKLQPFVRPFRQRFSYVTKIHHSNAGGLAQTPRLI